jgi:histidinol phosphatase-like PHP family hydrolase
MPDKSFTLIEGTFSPHDAAEVLLSVLSDKINFHEVQMLSCAERNSQGGAFSKKRFEALSATREEITELLKAARAQNQRFEIHSRVDITLIDG